MNSEVTAVDPLLDARGLTRHFGHVRALNAAAISLQRGEVRALAGANGSGKSTLIKILSGFHVPEGDASLQVAGLKASFPMKAEDFDRLGVFCVHQDLGLIPELSVVDNMTITEIARRSSLLFRPSEMAAIARKALESVDLGVDLEAKVEQLSRSDRALLALARAFWGLQTHQAETGRSGVLILDEITAFLPRHEVPVLQRVIRQVSDHGHGVIFVSHDLDEVMGSADSVTVLRDGSVVTTTSTTEVDHASLVRHMIGRDLQPAVPPLAGVESNSRPTAVRVTNLSGVQVESATFSLDKGEILGVTGVLGSGFESIPYLLFGAQKATAGSLTIGGTDQRLTEQTPGHAIARGIGLIPGDRHAQGLFMELEIAENVGSLRLEEHTSPLGLLVWRKLRRGAAQAVTRYEVLSDGVRSRPQQLSGGNQQKVLLSRWLPHVENLLLLHEPVQGVDVSAREAIIGLLKERALAGVPIICASSDYELLVRLCDRALVMKDGAVKHELKADRPDLGLDKDRLVELCIGDMDEVA